MLRGTLFLAGVGLLFASAGRADDTAVTASPVVDHQPLTRAPRGAPVTIRAQIVSPVGQRIFEPTVYVRIPGLEGFARVEMKPESDVPDVFVARLSEDLCQSDFDYFIEAYDVQGHVPVRKGSPEAPLHVTLEAAAPPAPAPQPIAVPPKDRPLTPTAVATPAPPASEGWSRRTWGELLGIGGAVLAVAGGGAGYFALTEYNAERTAASAGDFPSYSQAKATGKSAALVADILYVAGALAIGTGIYLVLSQGGAVVTVAPSPTGAGVQLGGRF